MSNVKTITELLMFPAGEPVIACRGKVSKVFRHYTGQSKRKGAKVGDLFKLQHLILEDPADPTATIKVVLDDRDALPADWKGKVMALLANGRKEGLTIEDEVLDGGTYPMLRVSPAAEISPLSATTTESAKESAPAIVNAEIVETPPAEPEPPTPAKPQPAPQSVAPSKAEAPPAAKPTGLKPEEAAQLYQRAIVDCKMQAGRTSNLWRIAYKTARQTRVDLLKEMKEDMTEAMYESFVSHIAARLVQLDLDKQLPVQALSAVEGEK
jgi:hypothetical protein